MPVLYRKPDLLVPSPLEPTVQGRKHITAQVGGALYIMIHYYLRSLGCALKS